MTPEIRAFIDHHADSPNPFGAGTIGQAWARSGREKYGAENVKMAQEEISRFYARQSMRIEAGYKEDVPPWDRPVETVVREPVPGMVIGGST